MLGGGGGGFGIFKRGYVLLMKYNSDLNRIKLIYQEGENMFLFCFELVVYSNV